MGQSRNWTEEELKNLSDYLNEGKSYKDIAIMMNRSVNGIALKAQRLNRKQNGPQRQQNLWTQSEIDILTEGIANFESPSVIARKLNRTETSVELKARKLGIPFRGSNRLCRDDELESIYEDWQGNELTLYGIARKYNRSPNAIKILAQRNKFGHRSDYACDLSIIDVCDCLNVSRDRVETWIKNKWLRRHTRKVGRVRYHIVLDELLEFMETHQDLYNAVNVSNYIFPTEIPDWFREKYKKDMNGYSDNWHREYTDEEDRKILRLYKSGTDVKEIAKMLGRTESGVRSRLTVLSEGRMSPKYYTDEEIDILRTYGKFETLYDIQKRLKNKRSIKSLQYKCEALEIEYHLSKDKCK